MKFLDMDELPWGVLFYTLVTLLTIGLFINWFADKKTTGYSLETFTKENIGQRLYVEKEISNYPDEEILLPDTMNYWEAARFVDSLNHSLNHSLK